MLIEPRRMRDRARPARRGGRPGGRAGSTWGRDVDRGSRACTPSPTACWRTPERCGRSTRPPESPARRWWKRRGGAPSPATATGLGHRLAAAHDGYRVVVAADTAGSAARLHEVLLDHGLDLPGRRRVVDLARPGGHVVVAPLHQGRTVPAAKWP